MNNNSKFILGAAVGAAIGAAVGYVLFSGKKDEWLEALEEKAGQAKEDLEVVVDKINKSVQGIINRA